MLLFAHGRRGRHGCGGASNFSCVRRDTAALSRVKLGLYGRYTNKPHMCDVKLNTDDNFNMGFVFLRPTAPESGALAGRHHRGEFRTFCVFVVRAIAARRRA